MRSLSCERQEVWAMQRCTLEEDVDLFRSLSENYTMAFSGQQGEFRYTMAIRDELGFAFVRDNGAVSYLPKGMRFGYTKGYTTSNRQHVVEAERATVVAVSLRVDLALSSPSFHPFATTVCCEAVTQSSIAPLSSSPTAVSLATSPLIPQSNSNLL